MELSPTPTLNQDMVAKVAEVPSQLESLLPACPVPVELGGGKIELGRGRRGGDGAGLARDGRRGRGGASCEMGSLPERCGRGHGRGFGAAGGAPGTPERGGRTPQSQPRSPRAASLPRRRRPLLSLSPPPPCPTSLAPGRCAAARTSTSCSRRWVSGCVAADAGDCTERGRGEPWGRTRGELCSVSEPPVGAPKPRRRCLLGWIRQKEIAVWGTAWI